MCKLLLNCNCSGSDLVLERQLVNSSADLFTHIHCSGINRLHTCYMLILHEQTRIVATRLFWTTVILISMKASGLLSNSRYLKRTVKWYIESFWRPKGGLSEPPQTPPCLRACNYLHITVQQSSSSILDYSPAPKIPPIKRDENAYSCW